MKYIDYGLTIIHKKSFESYPDEESFNLSEVYHDLSIKEKIAGFEVYQRFYEIGSIKGLMETN